MWKLVLAFILTFVLGIFVGVEIYLKFLLYKAKMVLSIDELRMMSFLMAEIVGRELTE